MLARGAQFKQQALTLKNELIRICSFKGCASHLPHSGEPRGKLGKKEKAALKGWPLKRERLP
jgi:hypothetical protein